MSPLKKCALGALLFVLNGPAAAWSDHASLLWPLARTLPALTDTTVSAESLESFVVAEAGGLQALLAGLEGRMRAQGEAYAPRPDGLAFRAGAGDPRAAFLAAIRVNPSLPYGLYWQDVVWDDTPAGAAALRFQDLSFLTPGVPHRGIVYRPLAAGAAVTPAQVLATASDEPDLGMDVGLFEDNGTPFGARYGFGAQPFGNPNLDYGSQAPFHMGFYHLDWLTRKAQPGLLTTYPAWRIELYGALARFAFDRGHDYWGWRFAGWALHYIGDLTQPYHARPLPGVSTARALWLVLRGRSAQAVQLVSNRHGVLESYQYQRVRAALDRRDWESPLLQELAGGEPAPAYDADTPRGELSRDSSRAGAALDAALEAHVPARFVSDPAFEWTRSGEEAAVVETVRCAGGDAAVAALDAALAIQFRRFSGYARAWIEHVRAAGTR